MYIIYNIDIAYTYIRVEQLMPVRRDEVQHPVDGAGQRRPAPEQREQHHVREQRCEVRHLKGRHSDTHSISLTFNDQSLAR